jgi:ABC-type transport system involved in cytochrome bd biosynthesis fused ATPase/permease subunit
MSFELVLTQKLIGAALAASAVAARRALAHASSLIERQAFYGQAVFLSCFFMASNSTVILASILGGQAVAFLVILGYSVMVALRLRVLTRAATRKQPNRFARFQELGKVLGLSVAAMAIVGTWCELYAPSSGRLCLVAICPVAESALRAAFAVTRATRCFKRQK